ncbi:MAG: glycosidase, partial [Phycisphaerae bacterium]|nr:glycosidase [Phycisphaerae bacterium]
MGETGIQAEICRLPQRLVCDASRTIARFFWPGDETRARKIIDRVLRLSEKEVSELLQNVLNDFDNRHPDLHEVLVEHYNKVIARLNLPNIHSPERQFLIGSYFTMEYSFESAALFNPSMIPAKDQSDVPAGSIRFLMSLRAVGEGHISSIVFRRGIIDENINIIFDPVTPCPRQLRREENRAFKKFAFRNRLLDIGAYSEGVEEVFKYLPERFTSKELLHLLEQSQPELKKIPGAYETIDRMVWLARSNYEVHVPPASNLAEVVLFP